MTFVTSIGRLLHSAFLVWNLEVFLQCNLISYYKLNWLIGRAPLPAVLCFLSTLHYSQLVTLLLGSYF